MTLSDAYVIGSKIGMCGYNVTLHESIVSTSGRGCSSNNGLGKGIHPWWKTCAASGASHGGVGGAGGSVLTNHTEQERCVSEFEMPPKYGSYRDSKYTGSGGGSYYSDGG